MEIMSDEFERCITYLENKRIVDSRLNEIKSNNRIIYISTFTEPIYIVVCHRCRKSMRVNDPCIGEVVVCKECAELYKTKTLSELLEEIAHLDKINL